MIRSGDSCAAQALWERYFPGLVRLARDRLRGTAYGVADEEDIAVSVMESLFRAAQDRRFPDLGDRHNSWRLLWQMTVRKVVDPRRHENRQCRGGGHVFGESGLGRAGFDFDPTALAHVIGDVPTPEFAAIMAEECQLRLNQLNDPDLVRLVQAKLEGYTNEETAEQFECSVRTVERRLRLVRKKWEEE